jgi:hypothetical protein
MLETFWIGLLNDAATYAFALAATGFCHSLSLQWAEACVNGERGRCAGQILSKRPTHSEIVDESR